MLKIVSLLGIGVFLSVAWVFSKNRKRIDKKLVLSGVLLQLGVAALILWTRPGLAFFEGMNSFVLKIVQFSQSGSRMVFGEGFREHFFAFSVLPSIIFFSALMSVLFHFGVMQKVVGAFSWLMRKTMRVSGAEATVASARIFVGGVEATMAVRPYVPEMTRSEIMTIMTAGMATIAGGVLAAFAGMGINAGHLLTAQVISAIGALVYAKILFPETATPGTLGKKTVSISSPSLNVFEAACSGASDGLRVAAIVGGVLIVFVGFTELVNHGLALLPHFHGSSWSMERILGWVMRPLVFLTGASWEDTRILGMLLGKKIFLNEFLAFIDLAAMRDSLNSRSVTLATYFLCGFGNFSAVAMQMGGLSQLFPMKRGEISELALLSLLGGTLTSLTSACIAGILT